MTKEALTTDPSVEAMRLANLVTPDIEGRDIGKAAIRLTNGQANSAVGSLPDSILRAVLE